jgi:diguanylate cyclase (GGDEF)-like protein
MSTAESQKEQHEQLHLRRRVHGLEMRDFQLWSIVILIIVVLAVGIVGLVLPNLMWRMGTLHAEGRYLPQLFFAFVTLVILFNVYILQQRRELSHSREELVRQIMYNEAAERLSMVDPLTETFNRRYMDQILEKDLSRAERQGISLVFLMIDVNDFKSVNTRFGHLVGDQILIEVATVLKNTFRASDIIIRYGGDEFLVMLSDCNEQDAQRAIERLQSRTRRWSENSTVVGYKMSLSFGLAEYGKGANLTEVLNAADRMMYEYKAKLQQSSS